MACKDEVRALLEGLAAKLESGSSEPAVLSLSNRNLWSRPAATSQPEAAVESQRHSVWIVYDLYRTARLNRKYYGFQSQRLWRIRSLLNLIPSVLLALGIIIGLLFYDEPISRIFILSTSFITLVLMIVRIFFNPDQQLTQNEQIHMMYFVLERQIENLVLSIRGTGSYGSEFRGEFRSIREMFEGIRRFGITVLEPMGQ